MIFEIYTPKNPMSTVGSSSLAYFCNCLLSVSIVNKSKQIIIHIDLKIRYSKSASLKICQTLEVSLNRRHHLTRTCQFSYLYDLPILQSIRTNK